jgi:tRNA pseudouridine32 synthase / 23S rRNA pseudouridine746 synthase
VCEDTRYVVVEKPAGMLSVPGRGPEKQDCAAARVAARFPRATGPLVVHRLDMETSGLLVFALDAQAQRDLSMQFERRQTGRSYIALLSHAAHPAFEPGHDPLAGDQGEINLPMRLDVDNRPIQVVDHDRGRASLTRWRTLARQPGRIRIEFTPETGRTHQLRVHAAAGLHRPIIGDRLYGGQPAERLMLHATYLSFAAPDGERVEFRSPAPF